MDEGQIWEAAMCAAKYSTDNLTAICDCNRVQLDGPTNKIMPLGDLKHKWQSFGWETIVVDGHSIDLVDEAYHRATTIKGRPQIIIAETTKGKGVSFMENQAAWHGKCPTQQEYLHAENEIMRN